jgi:uncharacterized membrane protein
MTGALSEHGSETPMAQDAKYPLGVAMVLVAGVCLSFGGLILRHVESADIWLMVFYRSLTFSGTLFLFLLVVYRGRVVRPFLAIGREGVVVALSLGAGAICYLLAIDLTTVANVVFILGSGPLWTALLGRLVLGERVRPVTWAAMAAALCGITLMVAEGLGSGRLAGNVIALGAAVDRRLRHFGPRPRLGAAAGQRSAGRWVPVDHVGHPPGAGRRGPAARLDRGRPGADLGVVLGERGAQPYDPPGRRGRAGGGRRTGDRSPAR